jgi:hypothetical protein
VCLRDGWYKAETMSNPDANAPTDPPVTRKPRRLGFLAGQIEVPDDFDTLGQAEIEQLFYGTDGSE